MPLKKSRRHFLTALSGLGAAGLVGAPNSFAQEAPPETTTIRLAKMPGICIAPQYVAEEMLKSEGFTDIQYFESGINLYPGFAAGRIDISIAYVAPFIFELDAGAPIVLLGGVHTGCCRAVRHRTRPGYSRPQGQDRRRTRVGVVAPCVRRQHGCVCRP
jgi:NitT/TauT family transport system substrate-binding protein